MSQSEYRQFDDPKTEATAATAGQVSEPPKMSSVKELLQGAVKTVRDEIDRCSEEIERWEARKEELQQQFNEALKDLLPQKEKAPAKPDSQDRRPQPQQQPAKRGRRRSQDSIHDLILSYMEEHKQATTAEIRKYLMDQGRTTNPGVELSRMVKNGEIDNVERGLYELVSR